MEETIPYAELGNVTAIVASTLIVVEIIKRAVGNVAMLKAVPTWIYAILTSVALTLIARYVLGSLPEGPLGPMLWNAALAAASASGFYSWLRKPGDTPAAFAATDDRASRLIVIAPLFAALCLGGCGMSNAQQYKLASSTYTSTMTSLTRAMQLGELELDTAERIDVVSDEIFAALDAWELAIIEGRSLDAQSIHGRIRGLLDELIRLQIEAERKRDGKRSVDGADGAVGSVEDRGRNHRRSAAAQPRTDRRRARLDPVASRERTQRLEGRAAAAARTAHANGLTSDPKKQDAAPRARRA